VARDLPHCEKAFFSVLLVNLDFVILFRV
jgi:hypothetical protein